MQEYSCCSFNFFENIIQCTHVEFPVRWCLFQEIHARIQLLFLQFFENIIQCTHVEFPVFGLRNYDKCCFFRYFIEVLDSSTYDCTEIFCYDNGSWEPIDGDKKTFQTIGTPYQQNKSATSPAVGTDLTSPVKVEDSPNTHSENNSASMRRSSVSSATSKSAVATKEGPKEEKSKASAQAPVPEEQEEPPEVVDLCSDSDDEEPAQKEAPPARPVSAISLSSASPAESNPNNGSVPHPKESSPFPSPPLMPNHELQRAANHSQSERAYETRKR